MAYTKRQIITCASIVYLVLVTALAAYASSRTSKLSVPIPDALSGFTTALPIIAGLLLEGGYGLNRRRERPQRVPRGGATRPPFVIIVNTLIFIYSTVVITLLGTHAAPPAGLNCGLERGWKTMFAHKNAGAIRAIQDAFNCCGLVNSHDMAWPFPDKRHDTHACESAFGRTNGCLGAWRREEQHMAGILMGAVGLVFVWQLAIIATPTQRSSWLHRVLPDRVSRILSDEEQGSNGPRRSIDYLPNFSHYSDNIAEEVSDGETESTPRRAIEGGVQHVNNTLTDPGREEEHRPTVENEWTRN